MKHGPNARVPLVLPLEHSQQNIKQNKKTARKFYIPSKPPRRESSVKESQSHWTKKHIKDTSTQTCLYCNSKECQTSPVEKTKVQNDIIPCLSELADAQHILQDIQELFNHENDESDGTGDTDLHLYDIVSDNFLYIKKMFVHFLTFELIGCSSCLRRYSPKASLWYST